MCDLVNCNSIKHWSNESNHSDKNALTLSSSFIVGSVQLVKTDGGVVARTDHGEEIEADVVLFATGKFSNPLTCMSLCTCFVPTIWIFTLSTLDLWSLFVIHT